MSPASTRRTHSSSASLPVRSFVPPPTPRWKVSASTAAHGPFQREKGDLPARLYSRMAGNIQRKAGLAHARAGAEQNQVRPVQARNGLVQLLNAGRHSAEFIAVRRIQLVQAVKGVENNLVYPLEPAYFFPRRMSKMRCSAESSKVEAGTSPLPASSRISRAVTIRVRVSYLSRQYWHRSPHY